MSHTLCIALLVPLMQTGRVSRDGALPTVIYRTVGSKRFESIAAPTCSLLGLPEHLCH